MSSLLGCKLNARIAAISPVSGLRWPAPCSGRPIPVLTFHGLADTQNLSDGELYWIIANGIRLTGMPAWGTAYGGPNGDEEIWSMVAYIKSLEGQP